MTDQRHRDLKELTNSLRFLLSRQEFHIQQIKAEQTRLLKSMERSTTTHKKMEHVENIHDYQLLLAENLRQLQIHHDKLQQFLDFNPDLSNTEQHNQAGKILSETLAMLKQLDESRDNDVENGGKNSEQQN